jgi:hypothetical protein
VLWQNGNKSYYPARIGAKVVSAYVEKQRRIANNLQPPKTAPPPVEMTAIYTVPGNPSAANANSPNNNGAGDQVKVARLLVDHGQVVGEAAPDPATNLGAPSMRRSSAAWVGNHDSTPATPHQPPSGSIPNPTLPGSRKGQ